MSTPLNPLTDYNFAEKGAAQAGGNTVPLAVVFARDPLSTDIYPVGQLWYSTASSKYFDLQSVSAGVATWAAVGSNALTLPLTVANGGTGATSLTAHGVLVGEGTTPISALAVGTNGQVLVGSTGADPVFATLTSSDGSVTFTTGAGTLSLQATGSVLPVVTNNGTTYTLALTDANKFQVWTAGTTATITVPTNASVAFPVSTEIDFFQQGAGQVVFAAAGGVTIQSANSNLKMAVQFGGATLKKVATDTWALVGNLTA